jgi:hypothetical protein
MQAGGRRRERDRHREREMGGGGQRESECACVRACVRACACAFPCACVRERGGGREGGTSAHPHTTCTHLPALVWLLKYASETITPSLTTSVQYRSGTRWATRLVAAASAAVDSPCASGFPVIHGLLGERVRVVREGQDGGRYTPVQYKCTVYPPHHLAMVTHHCYSLTSGTTLCY